jgi:hypothetical protein
VRSNTVPKSGSTKSVGVEPLESRVCLSGGVVGGDAVLIQAQGFVARAGGVSHSLHRFAAPVERAVSLSISTFGVGQMPPAASAEAAVATTMAMGMGATTAAAKMDAGLGFYVYADKPSHGWPPLFDGPGHATLMDRGYGEQFIGMVNLLPWPFAGMPGAGSTANWPADETTRSARSVDGPATADAPLQPRAVNESVSGTNSSEVLRAVAAELEQQQAAATQHAGDIVNAVVTTETTDETIAAEERGDGSGVAALASTAAGALRAVLQGSADAFVLAAVPGSDYDNLAAAALTRAADAATPARDALAETITSVLPSPERVFEFAHLGSPFSLLADSVAAFIEDSASIPRALAQANTNHTGPWTLTFTVLAADVVLLTYMHRRGAKLRRRTALES